MPATRGSRWTWRATISPARRWRSAAGTRASGDYLAAINRFKRVVDEYQTTTHVPEALERLTECYLALGLTDEARRTAAVLGYNYPGSKWYEDTYALVTDGGGTETAGAERGWFGWIGSIF